MVHVCEAVLLFGFLPAEDDETGDAKIFEELLTLFLNVCVVHVNKKGEGIYIKNLFCCRRRAE